MCSIEKKIHDNLFIRTPHQFYEVGEYEFLHPQKEIKNISANLMAGRSNVIGIHIRRSDNVKSIEQSPTESFINYMKLELLKKDSVSFFLATDSEADRRRVKDIFGDHIITQDKIELSRNSSDGIKSACVDLLCLSWCEKIVGSYWSSFSETAALWYGKKELIVITENLK